MNRTASQTLHASTSANGGCTTSIIPTRTGNRYPQQPVSGQSAFAESLSFGFFSHFDSNIERLCNCDREYATLACVERVTPLAISFSKIGNRTARSLKPGDALRNGTLRER
jgi:hypothetical protein